MKLYPLIILLISSVLFTHCTPIRNTGTSEKSPEEYLQFDKTTIGITTLAENINIPWEITWGPDDWIWYTEQAGKVWKVNPKTGEKKHMLTIPDVWMKRSTGLLGMVLHPNNKEFPFLFVDYTSEKGNTHITKLVRYEIGKDTLINPTTLLEIEASGGHNGSRLVLQDDTHLFWATGDVAKKGYAQDSTKLNGKILRLKIDGTIPSDNPIKNSYVYAWGLRNMQGMAISDKGELYVSEHGDAIEDEINHIKPLQNYGWQDIEGFEDTDAEKEFARKNRTTEPMIAWTPTIAPAGLDYYNHAAIPEWRNALLLTSLKNSSLRILKLNEEGNKIISDEIALKDHYGRLRDLCVSPDGDIFISTSNRDWNPGKGFPIPQDDRILKLSVVKKATKKPLNLIQKEVDLSNQQRGAVLYSQYCQSCHKENGEGVPGSFPALKGSKMVKGNPQPLMVTVLKGTTSEVAMPAFGFLSDDDLAAVISYIRTSWDNQSTEVTPWDIKQVRR